jgi:hypothetical protein
VNLDSHVSAASPSHALAHGGRLSTIASVLALVAVAAALQFAVVHVPYDADTAYHVAVARLLREHGILRAFPWTPFSWLSDHYADKELLFHLLLAPVAGLRWTLAAQIMGTIAGAAILIAIFGVLRAERVRYAALWALAPLLACEVFVFRFSIVRPHLLSIALAIVVLWAAARGRLAALAIASALYPWCYVAWYLPLVLVAIAEAARAASGERVGWKAGAVALGGIAAGIALHPNALNLLRFTWIVLGDVLIRNAWGARQGIELGREFDPFTTGEWARWLLVAAVMAVAAAVLAWRDRRRGGPVPLAFALAALAFGLLTVRTARFAEYFAPLATTAFALAAQHVAWRPLAAVALGLSALYGAPSKLETVEALGSHEDLMAPALEASLARAIPPGAQVFTCEWGLTGRMMLALPERRFLVALDPTLFLDHDPELYQLWYRLPREAPAGAAAVIRERFGARYVICRWDARFRRFFDRLAFEPGVRMIALAEDWNAYALTEP